MSAPESDRAAIRQTIRALRKDGYTLDYVNDGEEEIKVSTEGEAIDAIMAVDDAWLFVRHPRQEVDCAYGWVRFVLGNSPDEVICDNTTNLEDTLGPLTKKWGW